MAYLLNLSLFLAGLLAIAVGIWGLLSGRSDPGLAALAIGLGVGLVVAPPALRPWILAARMRRLARDLGGRVETSRDGSHWGRDLGRAWDPSEIKRFRLLTVGGLDFAGHPASVELARYWAFQKRGDSTSVNPHLDLVVRLHVDCPIRAQVLRKGVVGTALAMAEGQAPQSLGTPVDEGFLVLTPVREAAARVLDAEMAPALESAWTTLREAAPWQVAMRLLLAPAGVSVLLEGISAPQISPAKVRIFLRALMLVAERIRSL